MNKIKAYIKSPKFKENILLEIKRKIAKIYLPEIKRSSSVLFFTFIYCIADDWLLEQSNVPMYSGGITGHAKDIRDLFIRVRLISASFENVFMSIIIVLTNIPILLLGWF